MIEAIKLWLGNLSSNVESMWLVNAAGLAFVFAVTQFIRKVSRETDEEIDVSKKESVSYSLIHIEQHGIPLDWIPNFNSVFDSFFGERHLSLKCFVRCSIISALTFIVFLILLIVHDQGVDSSILFAPVVGLALCLIFNIPVDYISLLETRMVLNLRIPTIVKLLLDVLLSIVIFIFWIYLLFLIAVLQLFATRSDSGILSVMDTMEVFVYIVINGWRELFNLTKNDEVRWLLVVPLITTFTTSIWLWLHGLAELTIKLLSPIKHAFTWLNTEDYPFTAIGRVINFYIWSFFAVFVLVRLLVTQG